MTRLEGSPPLSPATMTLLEGSSPLKTMHKARGGNGKQKSDFNFHPGRETTMAGATEAGATEAGATEAGATEAGATEDEQDSFLCMECGVAGEEVYPFCKHCVDAHADHPSACDDPECMLCAVRDCPSNEALHYRRDGCPACERPSDAAAGKE